ncbi:hypothetical protein AMJ48_03215 [Parcubacteria bacterium DG_74_1]|nr:MAG: hypothetical protein AMJ48_03215 [Parcubacteria bacterium DG_74_1]
MTLQEIKKIVKTYQANIVLLIGVILISLLSFAMRYIVARSYYGPPLELETFEIIENKEL